MGIARIIDYLPSNVAIWLAGIVSILFIIALASKTFQNVFKTISLPRQYSHDWAKKYRQILQIIKDIEELENSCSLAVDIKQNCFRRIAHSYVNKEFNIVNCYAARRTNPLLVIFFIIVIIFMTCYSILLKVSGNFPILYIVLWDSLTLLIEFMEVCIILLLIADCKSMPELHSRINHMRLSVPKSELNLGTFEEFLLNRNKNFTIIDLTKFCGTKNSHNSYSYVTPMQWRKFISINLNKIKDVDFYFYSDWGTESYLIARLFNDYNITAFNLGKIPKDSFGKRLFFRTLKLCEFYFDRDVQKITQQDFYFTNFNSEIRNIQLASDDFVSVLPQESTRVFTVDFGNFIYKEFKFNKIKRLNQNAESASEFQIPLDKLWMEGTFVKISSIKN